MNTRPTVSETKRAFYTHHTRPINSVYRRVVEELLVEMHLLRVNDDFRYDAVYALGVVSSFNRFMDGYEPEAERESIFKSLCLAEDLDPQKLRTDADNLIKTVESKSLENLMSWFKSSTTMGMGEFEGQLKAIADNSKFKYSRLFGIGLYTLMETVDATTVKDEKKLTEWVQSLSDLLKISAGKLQKDVEFYHSNVEKVQQARKTIEEIIEADRKRQEQRLAEQQAKKDAETDGASLDTTSSDTTEEKTQTVEEADSTSTNS